MSAATRTVEELEAEIELAKGERNEYHAHWQNTASAERRDELETRIAAALSYLDGKTSRMAGRLRAILEGTRDAEGPA